MSKSLILKVSRVLFVVLIAVSFFLPFVTGQVYSPLAAGFVKFKDSLFNVTDFAERLGSTSDSPQLFVYLYMVLVVALAAVLFLKEAYARIANLVVIGVGLIIHGYVYFQVFIDKSPELEAALKVVHPQLGHTLTMNIGFGFFFGLVVIVLATLFEFFGEKVLKA